MLENSSGFVQRNITITSRTTSYRWSIVGGASWYGAALLPHDLDSLPSWKGKWILVVVYFEKQWHSAPSYTPRAEWKVMMSVHALQIWTWHTLRSKNTSVLFLFRFGPGSIYSAPIFFFFLCHVLVMLQAFLSVNSPAAFQYVIYSLFFSSSSSSSSLITLYLISLLP